MAWIAQAGVYAMESLCQTLCAAMILAKPIDHGLERDNAGGCERSRLAHIAADHAPVATGSLDEFTAPAQNRADWCRQSF